MAKKTMWVLVADGARARLFARAGGAHARLGAPHKEWMGDRRVGREMITDRPGRTHDSAGPGRHAMEPPGDPRELEEEKFLTEIAAYISSRTEDYDDLILVAPAAALGTLRQKLSKQAMACVRDEFVKDLTKETPSQLDVHLRDLMGR